MNVFRPVLSSSTLLGGGEEGDGGKGLLPVVVFFHGGAFNTGYGHVRDMASFVAWSEEKILGVSFNYRTGVFGFLPLSVWDFDCGEGEEKEGVLNVGLRDQVQALRWVRENIRQFGGDKQRVTVMGSSAGAHSLGHLLLLELDDGEGGLFHRVIMESGASTARACYPFDHPLHTRQLNDFLGSLGIEEGLESKEVVKRLREMDVEIIKKASDALFEKYNPSVQWPFQAVIDGPGGMIPQAPITSLKQEKGKTRKIPILTGFNANEGSMFISPSISTSEEFTSFFRTLLPNFTEEDLAELNNVYPDPLLFPESRYREDRKGLGAQFRRAEQAYGHFAYTSPVRQTAFFASSKSTTGSEAPIYLYHFAPSISMTSGADHGTQSPFVVHGKDVRTFSETISEISGTMHAYWSSFVATGDPNAVRKGRFAGRPLWNAFGRDEKDIGEVAVFGKENDEVAGGTEKGVVVRVERDEWAREECKFWWRMKEKLKC